MITVESHLGTLGSLDLVSKPEDFVIIFGETSNQRQQTAA